ncbi:MAG: FAD-dependent oxidoreductase [Gammaproteobacteria bacterium]|nr:MAG: FAD-dependent oxidoreductase [Gammaproteobacteria bacterium]
MLSSAPSTASRGWRGTVKRAQAAWRRGGAALLLGIALAGCHRPLPTADADLIVVGAGIAGLSAALEASDHGARVLVLEANSVGGGHAVMAGGLFLVDTPLQRRRGIEDSVELALRDMLTWGEDADERWLRRYVAASRPEVYDWLVAQGVEFRAVLPAPGETSVPRFHFTRGAALHVVRPLLREALRREPIEIGFGVEVTGLKRIAGGWRLRSRHLRSGRTMQFTAPAVIIASGGFEGSLEQVRAHWPSRWAVPPRLLNGAGHFATGAGLVLGEQAGAAVARLDHQAIFVTGLPDPRDPAGQHGLFAQNPAAIFVTADGRRFIDESAPRKQLEQAVLSLPGQSYWLIFDERGRRRLRVRGAPWLDRETLQAEILDNPAVTGKATSLRRLAEQAGLPPAALAATVQRYNAMLAAGDDRDFRRFGPERPPRGLRPIDTAPFYALRLYPMSRKSLGGLVIGDDADVLAPDGSPIPGLFAAGEVTGVAGINGRFGGSGTFLGPSVFTGRLAGRSAARLAGRLPLAASPPSLPAGEPVTASEATAGLAARLKAQRPGDWHFARAHSLVLERRWSCSGCHSAGWGPQPATNRAQRLRQLDSCERCH